MLKEMLTYQRVRKGSVGYNEVIVDAQEESWRMPELIEGIFETHAGHGTTVHAAFLATYGLSAAKFPLLRLDTFGHPDAPFSNAPLSGGW